MISGDSWRENFGQRLKILMLKAKIKQKDISDTLKCSQSFVSQVISGRSIFANDQFGVVYEMLSEVGVGDSDLNDIHRMFIEARANMDIKDIPIPVVDSDPLKQMIIEDLNELTQKQLKEVYRIMEKMKIKNLDQMADNAGI
jgi:transcriptional regulator with XRE-family HTH domain